MSFGYKSNNTIFPLNDAKCNGVNPSLFYAFINSLKLGSFLQVLMTVSVNYKLLLKQVKWRTQNLKNSISYLWNSYYF